MPSASPPTPRISRSEALAKEAVLVSPGGVHGAGRSFPPHPMFFKKSLGAFLWDVDGNKFLDYTGSFGPAALGLSEPRVCEAVADAMRSEGLLVALPHESEIRLGQKFIEHIPYAQKTTFHGGGGSDALYNALRLARTFTGRRKFIKFEGGYHGWHDELAISVRPARQDAGPDGAPTAVAMSVGGLPEHVDACLVAPFNDPNYVERLVRDNADQVAAIFIEPVVHSCGCLPLKPGFLQFLRQLCDANGILLVFDEIITGFRHGLEGAGAKLGVHPDIAAFGKAMANGFIIAALTGRRDVMSLMAPEGPVLFSGTFNAHNLSVAASLKTIEIMETEPVHDTLFRLGDRLRDGINEAIDRYDANAICHSYGSVWCLYLGTRSIENYRDIIGTASSKDVGLDGEYKSHLRRHGIFMYPWYINRGYISYAHTEADIDRTIEATDSFLADHRHLLERPIGSQAGGRQ